MQTVHFVFHPSAALSLRKALAAEGLHDRVIALFDDLSYGPLGLADDCRRQEW
jgi:hypothetical protein